MTYFVIMNDFGFLPKTLPGLALTKGYSHKKGDFYDPNHPTLGNSNIIGCDKNDGGKLLYNGEYGIPDWLYMKNLHTDLRMYYVKCSAGKVVSAIEWGSCHVK